MVQLTCTNVTRRLEFDNQKTTKNNVNDVVMLEKKQDMDVESNDIVSSIAFTNNNTLKTSNELQQKITGNMVNFKLYILK